MVTRWWLGSGRRPVEAARPPKRDISDLEERYRTHDHEVVLDVEVLDGVERAVCWYSGWTRSHSTIPWLPLYAAIKSIWLDGEAFDYRPVKVTLNLLDQDDQMVSGSVLVPFCDSWNQDVAFQVYKRLLATVGRELFGRGSRVVPTRTEAARRPKRDISDLEDRYREAADILAWLHRFAYAQGDAAAPGKPSTGDFQIAFPEIDLSWDQIAAILSPDPDRMRSSDSDAGLIDRIISTRHRYAVRLMDAVGPEGVDRDVSQHDDAYYAIEAAIEANRRLLQESRYGNARRHVVVDQWYEQVVW